MSENNIATNACVDRHIPFQHLTAYVNANTYWFIVLVVLEYYLTRYNTSMADIDRDIEPSNHNTCAQRLDVMVKRILHKSNEAKIVE